MAHTSTGYAFLDSGTFDPGSTQSGCSCGGTCGGGGSCGGSCGCQGCASIEKVPAYDARAILAHGGTGAGRTDTHDVGLSDLLCKRELRGGFL